MYYTGAKNTDSICDTRKFRARLIAHYIDNDFECCECETEV